MRYSEHPSCFLKDKPEGAPIEEKIGFLDIETTGLYANWDYIISYAITTHDNRVLGRVLEPEEVLDWDVTDKHLMKEFCDDIAEFDRLVVYWGKDRRHDIPFLRTRCLKREVNFPAWKEKLIFDVYDIARNKLSLYRRRLEAVAQFLDIPAKQHRLDMDIWGMAKTGSNKKMHCDICNKKHTAREWVWLHNVEDCVTLQKVYDKLEKFTSLPKTSI